MLEIPNTKFQIDSVLPTKGSQNKYLYACFLKYKEHRGKNERKATEYLHTLLKWLDPLVIRYAWVAKKWPKRDDFHDSYYRDWYRLRKSPPVKMEKEDLVQELRLRLLASFRNYRYKYKAPPGGYASRALFYAVKDLLEKENALKRKED